MKIQSRQTHPAHTVTDIEIRNVKIDCEEQYLRTAHSSMVVQRDYYIEVVVRIPLSDEDTSDINALGHRMGKLADAKLLEAK